MLNGAFPGQLVLRGEKDPGTTGNFEVRIAATGELIHSKTQGLCKSQAEKDNVVGKIRDYLAAHPLG